jgi:hypothetical protein
MGLVTRSGLYEPADYPRNVNRVVGLFYEVLRNRILDGDELLVDVQQEGSGVLFSLEDESSERDTAIVSRIFVPFRRDTNGIISDAIGLIEVNSIMLHKLGRL